MPFPLEQNLVHLLNLPHQKKRLKEVFQIEYQWAQERYESFQKKLQDVMGHRKTYELSEEDDKKLEEIIHNDIKNKY